MGKVLSPQAILTSLSPKVHQTPPTTQIDTFLDRHQFKLQNVLGDGDCGIWALMRALGKLPDENCTKPTRKQYEQMKALRQKAAIAHEKATKGERKREAISNAATDETKQLSTEEAARSRATHEMTQGRLRTAGHEGWKATDDFSYFAQLPEVNRPIIVIRDNCSFETYFPNGDAVAARSLTDYENFSRESAHFLEQYQQPIFIYYNGVNHYQAIVPISSSSSSSSSSFLPAPHLHLPQDEEQ